MFGPEGGRGEESFDILVCTPQWLASEVQSRGAMSGRHLLVVESFDSDEIRAFLQEYANGCAGSSWDEVALKLSRLGRWEFEDYNADGASDRSAPVSPGD